MATRLDAPLPAIMFNLLGAEIVGGVFRFCAFLPTDPLAGNSGLFAPLCSAIISLPPSRRLLFQLVFMV